MFICIYFSVNTTVRTDSPDATIYISTYVDLVCELNINSTSGVDIIFFNWTGPNGIVNNGSDYTITDQADNSILRIERLNVSRDNNAVYTCSVTAVLDNDTVEGTAIVQGRNSLTLRLQGVLKTIYFQVFVIVHYGRIPV